MKSQNAFKDAGLHFGVVGALAFIVFLLIFQVDWTERYGYLRYLIPLPLITLWIARKAPFPGGLLMIALGVGAMVFDGQFSPASPGQIAGTGLGYTLIFVAMPLALSGVFHLVARRISAQPGNTNT